MDSSFLTDMSLSFSTLTAVIIALGVYALVMFFKLTIQFGLPNHPARLTAYMVSFCVACYFLAKGIVGLGLVPPWVLLRYQALPLVAGSLALLLQVIMIVGKFSLIQQKVISRLPLMGALLCLAFFPDKAHWFVAVSLIAGGLFLTFSVGKARYQKRVYFKMCLFMMIFALLSASQYYWGVVAGHFVLFLVLFYFFIFQQTLGVAAMVDDFTNSTDDSQQGQA